MIIIGDDQVKYGAVGQMSKMIVERGADPPEIVDYLDADGVTRSPESIAQDIAGLVAGADAQRIGLVIDLADDSAATTPDKSFGLTVLRELALLMYANNEVDEGDEAEQYAEEVRHSIRDLYGDEHILILMHSKFALEPDLILRHWHLGHDEIQEKSAKDFRTWEGEDFVHSQTHPIVYSTYKTESGAILPKIVQWMNG